MNHNPQKSFRTGINKGIAFGIVLMLIGFTFLGFNFGLFSPELKHIIFSWQMIFVAIGLISLFQGKFVSASIWLLIGIFFILPHVFETFPELFPGFDGNFTHVYWPLLLICAGSIIIIQKIFQRKSADDCCVQDDSWAKRAKSTHQPGAFNKNSVFGSGEHIILEPEFSGGEINAIFGGIVLDLRKTNLREGETRLDVNAVFGGITLIVPNNWHIESHIDTVFGGFEDKRALSDNIVPDRKLIINGACVFGGGELRN